MLALPLLLLLYDKQIQPDKSLGAVTKHTKSNYFQGHDTVDPESSEKA